jgi:hypothetical protein
MMHIVNVSTSTASGHAISDFGRSMAELPPVRQQSTNPSHPTLSGRKSVMFFEHVHARGALRLRL